MKFYPQLCQRRSTKSAYTSIHALLVVLIVSVAISSNLHASETKSENIASPSFVLIGTIASTNSKPLALIKVTNEKLRFYSVNDMVDSYTITKIQRNKIQLIRNNILHTLRLHQKINSLNTQLESAKMLEVELPQQITIKRQLLGHIRSNIQQWLNAISLKLLVKDGFISGYLVESVSKVPLNAQIGLKPGDIIKSINGIHVSQPELFTKMIDKLIDSSNIYMKIERGHKTNILNFHVSK